MSRRLQSIDQALNELEQLASSNVATRQFLLLLLENAREYLEATSTQFLLPTTTSESTPWLKVASIPEATTLSAASLEQFPSHSDLGTPPSSNGGRSRSEEVQVWRGDATADAQELIAAAIKPGNLSKGMLVAEVGLAESPLEAKRQDELLKAYAELIGLRRDHDLDDLRQHWSQMAESLQALSDCEEQAESDFVLVNALARLCGASRVALVDHGRTVRAVSHVPNFDAKSEEVSSLNKLGQLAISQGHFVWRETESEDARPACLADNLVGLQFDPRRKAAVILEFANADSMDSVLSLLPDLIPPLHGAWTQAQRWLSLPSWIRTFAPRSVASPRRKSWFKAFCVSLLLVALFVLAWLPIPFMVEADGVYEPVNNRQVYATESGFIKQIFVVDGQQVKAGQTLVEIVAPELDREAERLGGERASVLEKVASLRVALNQLDPTDPKAAIEQTKLAAEIELQKQLIASLEKQLELLADQSARLTLTAPIDGRVVANDLQTRFREKPVQRGELLLKLADTEGPWQLRYQVDDRDLGHLLHFYENTDSPATFDFTFDSQPSVKLGARVSSIAKQANFDPASQRNFVEVRAIAEESEFEERPGVGVNARFQCGRRSAWFVWCRPLIEALQRRMIL